MDNNTKDIVSWTLAFTVYGCSNHSNRMASIKGRKKDTLVFSGEQLVHIRHFWAILCLMCSDQWSLLGTRIITKDRTRAYLCITKDRTGAYLCITKDRTIAYLCITKGTTHP